MTRYPIVEEILFFVGSEEYKTTSKFIVTHIYLDGSGGMHTSDKRKRRCGWSWIRFHIDHGIEIAGQWGTLPYLQTVPRSEIYALCKALLALKAAAFQGAVIIHTDSGLVMTGWQRGPKYTQDTEIGDAWDSVWKVYNDIYYDVQIIFKKVTSHVAECDLARYHMTLDNKIGNGRADELAGKGAAKHELSWQQVRIIDWVDSICALIIWRLLYIVQDKFPHVPRTSENYIVVSPPTFNDKITALGHSFTITHGRYHCSQCGQTYNKKLLKICLSHGRLCSN